MSELIAHAERELDLLQRGADEDEGEPDMFQREINRHLLAMVAAFSEDDPGHSGSSALYAIEMLGRLLRYEPITPLTGAEDEWMLVAEERVGRPGVYQNVRCGRVFREGDVAYDQEAVVIDGRVGWYSARRVSFPYLPRTRYVPRWLGPADRLWARICRRTRP